jgi:hypothetical protein
VNSRVTGFDPGSAPDRRTPSSQIRFYDNQLPGCPYKEVGRITTSGDEFVTWRRVVHKARDEASEMGGDAIISVDEKTRISGVIFSKTSASATQSNSFTGTVIRFTDPGCRE